MTTNIAFIHAVILKILSLSLMAKHPSLILFNSELKRNSLNPRKGCAKEKKRLYNNASELYNEYLEIYVNQ